MSSKPTRSRSVFRAGVVLAAWLIPAGEIVAQPTPSLVADLNTQPVNGNAFPPL